VEGGILPSGHNRETAKALANNQPWCQRSLFRRAVSTGSTAGKDARRYGASLSR